jgi:hypothetical protein
MRFFAALSESFLRGFHASVIRPTFLAKKAEPFVSARTLAFASCGHACRIGLDRLVPILLQKSFCTGDQKFSGP